jgi:hypothetical protein
VGESGTITVAVECAQIGDQSVVAASVIVVNTSDRQDAGDDAGDSDKVEGDDGETGRH